MAEDSLTPKRAAAARRLIFPRTTASITRSLREVGAPGARTRIETLFTLGRKPELAPEQSLMDGVNAARKTIPFARFDKERTKQGLEWMAMPVSVMARADARAGGGEGVYRHPPPEHDDGPVYGPRRQLVDAGGQGLGPLANKGISDDGRLFGSRSAAGLTRAHAQSGLP